MGFLQLAGVLIAGSVTTDSQFWKDLDWFLLQLPWQLVLILLYKYECLESVAKNAEDEAKKAEDFLKNISEVLKDPKSELVKYIENHMTKPATNQAKRTAKVIKQAAKVK
jgi:hypothetical protein